MKLTMKIFLIISLFCSVALADGDMEGGGLAGDMEGGGLNCAECMTDGDKNEEGAIFEIIKDYLADLLG